MSPDQPPEQSAVPSASERVEGRPSGSVGSVEEKQGNATKNEQPATQSELREFEKASLRLARRTLTATWVIAGVTGVYALVAFLQWRAMSGQLKSMDESGKDTKALASAAGSQTEQMKTLAGQTTLLAQKTSDLAEHTKTSATAAQDSAAATKDLATATAKAAKSSHDLAAAARDANVVSRELVKTTQQAGNINRNIARAYVFATDIKLNPIMSPLPPFKPIGWTANVTWDNTGNTPTNDLVVSANCWSAGPGILTSGPDVAKEHPDAFDVSTIKPGDKDLMRIPDAPHLIGPKSTKHSVACTISPMEAVFNGISYLTFYYYSFGTARYKDVFGIPHRTDFCFVFHLTGNGEVSYMDEATAGSAAKVGLKTLGIEAAFCQKHNCADEECDAEPLQPLTPPEPTKPPS
jgi:uncharacterized protein YoxC